jgi:hypothetical protein
MKEQIPQILSARVFREVLTGETQYDITFVTEFGSLEDMNLYLAAPAHAEAVNAIKESITATASLCHEA